MRVNNKDEREHNLDNELYQMDETLFLGELINMDELNRWICMEKVIMDKINYVERTWWG